jgi:hypothetical protein
MSVKQPGEGRAVDGAGRWVRQGSTIVLIDPVFQRAQEREWSELRPHRLARPEFELVAADGETALLEAAGASNKKPRILVRYVVLRATLKFDRDVALALGRMPETFYPVNIPRPSSGSVAPGPTGLQLACHVGYPPGGQGQRAAVMLQPAPGSREIQIVAWNSGQPVAGTVGSHAEQFFLGWLRHERLRGLTEMHVSINLSPCSHCARDLAGNNGGINAHLTYSIPFGGRYENHVLYENTTTVEDLAGIRGWTVHGPPPRWTDALKREERRIGEQIAATLES